MNSTKVIEDKYLHFWYDFLLKPIITYWSNEFYKYYDIYEDEFYKAVLPHDGSKLQLSIYRIRDLFPFVAYLLPIFNQLLIFWSFTWIIFIMFRYICTKKQTSIKRFNATCMVGMKFLLSFVLLILLLFTAIATFNVAFKLDSILRNSIHDGCNIINNIRNAKTEFELQLHEINRSVTHSLLSVDNMINELPETLYFDTYHMVKKDLDIVNENYAEIILKTEFIFEQLGLKITYDKIEQNLEKELNITAKLMNLFNNNIKILILNITDDITLEENDKNLLLKDILKIKNYSDTFNGEYKFADWMKVHNILQETYFEIIPKINMSMNFLKEYSENIHGSIKPNQKQLKNVIQNFQNRTDVMINKLFEIINNIFHSEPARGIKNIIELSNTTEYSFNRNTTVAFKNFYISTFLLLIPAIHTFLYVVSMLKCNIFGAYQVYFIYQKKRMSSYVPCFKIVSEIGLMLLWTGLLLSILCYSGALSLTVLCRPILTHRVYTQYLDNHSIWDNKTWLDTVVYPWNHNYTMKNILEKCNNNITVYQAFEVEKYWNISKEFQKFQIKADNKEWTSIIKNAVSNIELPNGKNTIIAKDNFNSVEKDLAYCSPHIPYDVELFENEEFKSLLVNLTKKYASTPFYEKLSQNLDVLNYIQNQNLEYLLSNFMEVKYLLKSNQKNLINIKNAEDHMEKKIKGNMEDLIQFEMYELENSIRLILNNLEKSLSYKVQNQMGYCQVYSDAKNDTEVLCSELPFVFNISWLIFDANALLMFISIILTRTLSTDVSKIRQEYRRNLKREAQERIIQQRQRIMNGTFLFDRNSSLNRSVMSNAPPQALVTLN